MSESDPEDSPDAPRPRDLATLRERLATVDDDDDPSMDGIGAGLGAMLLFGCPLGHWLGTDSSALVGLATGLGIGVLLFIGTVIVSAAMDSLVGKARSSAWTLGLASLGAAAIWFSMYSPMWVPLAMSATLPVVGFSDMIKLRRQRAAGGGATLLGLSVATVKQIRALPTDLPESTAAIIDRAISNVATIDRYIENGLVQRAALDGGALRRDIDRALHGLLDRAPLAAELRQRDDPELRQRADALEAALESIADQIASVADGVLLAASAEEVDALDALRERAEQLKLMAEGYAEVNRAVREG